MVHGANAAHQMLRSKLEDYIISQYFGKSQVLQQAVYNGPRNSDHIFQNHREHGMIKKTQRRDKP